MPDPHEDNHPIIIIRRKKHADHGHHGGAWKIAYADFVTAMMAFFLVMWLINAANEKTRAQVASYFNPIKLTDTTTSKKGLSNPKDRNPVPGKDKSSQADEKNKAASDPTLQKKAETPGDQPQYTEDQLFRNPYGILGLLAGQAINELTGHGSKGLAIAESSTGDATNGVSQRDPFDPYVWRTLEADNADAGLNSQKDPEKGAETTDLKAAPVPIEPPLKVNNDQHSLPVKNEDPIQKQIEVITPSLEPTPAIKKPEAISAASPVENDALAIRNRIAQGLKEFSSDESPGLDVKATEEGILISLTDNLNFDMFSVGSSQPQPKLVLMMEKISSSIKEYDGKIVIRGHTDSKQFRNGGNDNWRLSASRAQMAFYMLVRAGLDESKVERIEGYADHLLRYPDAPESAANRRIEILLKAKRS